tara:strand:+ start:1090 stop:1386 length:297 start_codon:yes stop_codon:yes gene_type:complete
MSKELTALKKDFKQHCPGIKVSSMEERHLPGWKRLVFKDGLNCDDMLDISLYLRNRFSVEGRYSHKLPKLHEYKGDLVLTFSEEEVQRVLLNKHSVVT